MLLFSSRDQLTLPGICLWVLISTIRLQCSYAFDIITHKTAAPSSSSSSLSSSSPSLLSFSSSSSYSPPPSLSSSNFNTLFPNRLYLQYRPLQSNPPSSSRLFKTHPAHYLAKLSSETRQALYASSRSQVSPTHSETSRHIAKRTISDIVPSLSPFSDNRITNDKGIDFAQLDKSIKEQLDAERPMKSKSLPGKDLSKLRLYFQKVQRIKSLKSALRRRMKEKSIMKAKLMQAKLLKENRLDKMANVKAIALSKSPSDVKISRSIKSRRAGYFVHNQGFHGVQHSHDLGDSSGSFAGLMGNENPRVFHGLQLDEDSVFIPGGTDGFIIKHLPKDTKVDFVINSEDGFLSASASSSSSSSPMLSPSLPQQLPSSSSAIHFPSQSGRSSFGDFLDAQPPTWQPLPPRQHQPPQPANSFGIFNSDLPSSMSSGGFQFPAVDPSPSSSSSSWNQGSPSGFSDSGDSFVSGFGSFAQNDRDCETISTKVCQSSRDCLCNGFYACMGSRCVLKGSNDGDDGGDSIGGVWHDAPPSIDDVVPQPSDAFDHV